MQTMKTTHQWVTLNIAPKYEIDANFPHYLRKNGVIYEPYCTSDNGYYSYNFTDIPETLHHRIIARQFVENEDPEHRVVVDHKNDDGKDNRIENLQWITQSENIKKRKSYTQQGFQPLDVLPPNAVPLGEYEGHTYSRYWVCEDHLVMQRLRGKTKYKVVNASPYRNGGHAMVTLTDDNGGKHMRGLTKILKIINARKQTSDNGDN